MGKLFVRCEVSYRDSWTWQIQGIFHWVCSSGKEYMKTQRGIFWIAILVLILGAALLTYQQTVSANRPVVINQTAVPPPPHDNSGHTWHHSDELLINITENGGDPTDNSKMTPFKAQLSREEIVAILEFIKSRWDLEKREYQWWITVRPNP